MWIFQTCINGSCFLKNYFYWTSPCMIEPENISEYIGCGLLAAATVLARNINSSFHFFFNTPFFIIYVYVTCWKKSFDIFDAPVRYGRFYYVRRWCNKWCNGKSRTSWLKKKNCSKKMCSLGFKRKKVCTVACQTFDFAVQNTVFFRIIDRGN